MGVAFSIDDEPTNINPGEKVWEDKANEVARGQRIKKILYQDGVVCVMLETGQALIIGAKFTAIGLPR